MSNTKQSYIKSEALPQALVFTSNRQNKLSHVTKKVKRTSELNQDTSSYKGLSNL